MKILTTCMDCLEKFKIPLSTQLGNLIDTKQDIDMFLVECKCNYGHESIQCLQAFRFEILFDIAMKELVEERYESAIYYFGVAKERFYWFFNRLVLRKLSNNKNIEDFFYKFTKNSSQMEEGIYLALYSLIFEETPKKFNSEIQNIRNRVIHQGEFTSYAECKRYGNEVLQGINFIIEKLKVKFPDFYIEELNIQREKLRKWNEYKDMLIKSTSTVGSVFLVNQVLEYDFDKLVERYNKEKELYSKEHLDEVNAIMADLYKKETK